MEITFIIINEKRFRAGSKVNRSLGCARGRNSTGAVASLTRPTGKREETPSPKPGPVFPRLQPKASWSLPSWTEPQVSVTLPILPRRVYAPPKPDARPSGGDQGRERRKFIARLVGVDPTLVSPAAKSITREPTTSKAHALVRPIAMSFLCLNVVQTWPAKGLLILRDGSKPIPIAILYAKCILDMIFIILAFMKTNQLLCAAGIFHTTGAGF
jgi:hypothetical protein